MTFTKILALLRYEQIPITVLFPESSECNKNTALKSIYEGDLKRNAHVGNTA